MNEGPENAATGNTGDENLFQSPAPAEPTPRVEPIEQRIAKFSNVLESAVEKVVKGQPGVVRHILVSLMVGGHVLLEGNPGTA
ncbi:MAG: hypothetical protein KDB29_03295, partial [Planctomycetes bacterium]|nr:hypothetical protein [Planctomycetota bacterium]